MVTMRSSAGMNERQDVEQRRLAGAGAARDQHVEPGLDDGLEQLEHRLGEALGPQQVLARERVALELTDREMGPVERQRLDDRVDAGAVGQARVHHGRGVVDAPADGRDDPVDHLQQVTVVLEHHVGALQPPVALDVHLLVGVDQDIGDLGSWISGSSGPEAEDLVQHLPDHQVPLVEVERHRFLGDEVMHDLPDGLGDLRSVQPVQIRQIESLEQTAMDAPLDLLAARGRWRCR